MTSRFQGTRLLKISQIRNALNALKLTLNIWQSKVPCMHEILTPDSQVVVCFTLTASCFQDTKLSKFGKLQMHRIASKLRWTHNSKKYLVQPTYLPLRPKFCSFSLYDQPFSRYRVVEIGKFRMHRKHLTVKSILYTLSTYGLFQISQFFSQPFTWNT